MKIIPFIKPTPFPSPFLGASPPLDVSVTVKGSDSLEVNWKPPESMNGELEHYKVEWTPPDGDNGGQMQVDGVQATIGGLRGCQEYIVSVYVVNTEGDEGQRSDDTGTTSVEGG